LEGNIKINFKGEKMEKAKKIVEEEIKRLEQMKEFLAAQQKGEAEKIDAQIYEARNILELLDEEAED
jgi:hypothetical protein